MTTISDLRNSIRLMTTSRSINFVATNTLPGLALVCLPMMFPVVALASGIPGEIHKRCGDAIAIVIGSPISYSEKEPSAKFAVEQWLKAPSTETRPTTRPAALRLHGRSGTGQTFYKLAKKGRFVVFVFPGNRTGCLGSIIEIDKDGNLPDLRFFHTLNPQPKTINDLVSQIRRILSPEYRKELILRLENNNLSDIERAGAAYRLGCLYAREAWVTLEAQASKPGKSENIATIRQSMLALFRIDEVKAAPICLSIVQRSRYDDQVNSAAGLLVQRPSDDPKALDILLDAARRWESEARFPTERPLPKLVQAISALGKRTPEVEALVMRSLEKGAGNVLSAAMSAAGHLKIRQAVPFIYNQLKNADKCKYLSASVAIGFLVLEDVRPYNVNQPISEDEARKTAADKFPAWERAIRTAETVDCCHGSRIVHASDGEKELYVFVTWQKQPDKPQPYRKAILLYRTDMRR